MNFISPEFVLLFAVTFIAAGFAGFRLRKYILLASSAVFAGYHSPAFLMTALLVTALSYVSGLFISRLHEGKGRDAAFWMSVALLAGTWLFFRYAGGFAEGISLVFPLGLSFYTFQALSYITEIYWGESEPERSLPDYALYMLFFMKFLSGPIERPYDFLPQLKERNRPGYTAMKHGAFLIFIGLVKKVMVADNLSPYVSAVFESPSNASGAATLAAALLYPIELYADFSGYTDMAIGGAAMLGFRLSPNFDRPFSSQTTAEFWRRWHISLSFWVRDYLYMPLSSITRGWGSFGIMFSLAATFVLLGMWHGAGMTFVVYGLIQGLVIIFEMKTGAQRQKLRESAGDTVYGFAARLRTYLIFAFSLVFFRSDSLGSAFSFLGNISFSVKESWTELNLGMSDHICIVTASAFISVMIFEYFMSRKDLFSILDRQHPAVRWSIYFILVFMLFSFGRFGADEFIYLQF